MEDFYDQITDVSSEESLFPKGFRYRDVNGTSIFLIQFDRFYSAYFAEKSKLGVKIQNIKDNIVKRVPLLFEKSELKIGREQTIRVLQGPDKVGNSVALAISRDFSHDLVEWMMHLDINPNTITMGNLMTPSFRDRRVVEYLLKKGVSPYIQYEDEPEPGKVTSWPTTWRCQRQDYSHNFEGIGEDALSEKSQEILRNLMREKRLCQCENDDCSKPRVKHAVCFSPFDSEPHFKSCFAENKSMVPFNCRKAILYGNTYDFFCHDTSMVFETTWEGQDAVMKCRKYIPKYHQSVNEACQHLTKILAEFSAAERSNENTDGVLAPLAYFRQQYLHYKANDDELDKRFQDPPSAYNQKKDHFASNSKVMNIDVLVYPKFDGTLRQLKILREDYFTAEELRKGFFWMQSLNSLN